MFSNRKIALQKFLIIITFAANYFYTNIIKDYNV